MKNGLLAFDDQGVPRIVSALKSGDDRCILRIAVDNLPLSFIPPLGSHNDDIGHIANSPDGICPTSKVC